MLYVGTEERMLLYTIFLLYIKKPCATSTPCAPQGAHRPGLLTLSHRHMSLLGSYRPESCKATLADHELCSSLIPLCVNKGKHACVLRLKSDRLNCLIVCRRPQQSASWKVESCMLARRKACETFPVLERKGAHLIYQMGDS